MFAICFDLVVAPIAGPQDGLKRNRLGSPARVAPLRQLMGQFHQLVFGEAPVFGENFIDQRQFRFGQRAHIWHATETNGENIRRGAPDEAMPGAVGQMLFFLRNPVKDGAQDRSMLHRDDRITRDRTTEPQQAFPINQIEQLDQRHVVHLAAALKDESSGRLNCFALVKFESDGLHAGETGSPATFPDLRRCVKSRLVQQTNRFAGIPANCRFTE